jgi:uncharacterized protein YjiS (DUF1127 family)
MAGQSITRQPSTVRSGGRPHRWLIAEWLSQWRDRQSLRDLSDAMLRDIGLTRYEIEREIDRTLWLRCCGVYRPRP